ncbi:MAG: hypothetical protein JHC26_11210 [Thermofilum sp.]|uniref:hypothetical protein n=1 Tax=Thermofilum sp. TaxID=1961369 RepID=UPI002585F4E9|nr:hypothetical protein [Thermofilum sp.]MCI4409649.1 hypothetical protein [Thermofilum sp.]
MEILEDGKVIYADPEFMEKALSILKEVRKNGIEGVRYGRRGFHSEMLSAPLFRAFS